jgi:endonuclease-3
MKDVLQRRGTYALIIDTATTKTVRFGAQAERKLSHDTYAYIGSALHSNGFQRVQRHHDVALGNNDTTHWHIDYLLHDATLTKALFAPEQAIECRTAQYLDGERIAQIGCTDCDCDTHLVGQKPASITKQLRDVGFTASHEFKSSKT